MESFTVLLLRLHMELVSLFIIEGVNGWRPCTCHLDLVSLFDIESCIGPVC